ncbi:MAG: hypothetical protein GWN21_17170, partial [Gammaproteobacteria bacterium]|nr:hypothetical protein [Gammaproteobacteria bacterium]NIW56906.1 hypothetical protein [Gammaproteobacteria bacterium]
MLGWIPTLLAVLSFLGSALGARNSGLFAYGTLFAGFALPGFRDAMWLGPAYDILERLLPPTFAALEANTTLREVGSLAALADLRPLLVYAMACGALGLALAVRAPRR